MTKSEYGEAVIKWVTITVLVVISIFFVFLYRNIFIKNTPQGHTENPHYENPINDDPPKEDINPEDTPVPPVIEYSEFPRPAYTNANGEFYNNTGGTGNDTLKDVINLAGYYYLILETNSNGNDYMAERNSIALAKFNYGGELEDTLTLKATRDEYYLASKITNNGILISAQGEGGIVYYLINFDFTYSKLQTADNYQQIKMYYTRDYTLVLGAKDNTLSIKGICDNLNILFANTIEYSSRLDIVDIFPSSYGYNIIVSLNNKTSYMTLINNSGDLSSNNLISNRELLKIIPVDGSFTILEKEDNSIYLRSIDNSLITQFDANIGDANNSDFYPVHNGYIAFLMKDTGTTTTHLSRLGEIITYNDRDYKDIKSIQSFTYTDDGIYFYANIESVNGVKDTRLINYSRNNLATYSAIIGGFMPDDAHTIIIKEDYAILFLTSMSYNTSFINNYGNKDVFIIKQKLT